MKGLALVVLVLLSSSAMADEVLKIPNPRFEVPTVHEDSPYSVFGSGINISGFVPIATKPSPSGVMKAPASVAATQRVATVQKTTPSTPGAEKAAEAKVLAASLAMVETPKLLTSPSSAVAVVVVATPKVVSSPPSDIGKMTPKSITEMPVTTLVPKGMLGTPPDPSANKILGTPPDIGIGKITSKPTVEIMKTVAPPPVAVVVATPKVVSSPPSDIGKIMPKVGLPPPMKVEKIKIELPPPPPSKFLGVKVAPPAKLGK